MRNFTVNLRPVTKDFVKITKVIEIVQRDSAVEIIRPCDSPSVRSKLFPIYHVYSVTSYFINIHRPSDRTSGLPKLLLHRTLWDERFQPANREITPVRLTKSFEIPLKLRDREAFRRVQRNGNFGPKPKRVDLNEFLRESRIPCIPFLPLLWRIFAQIWASGGA